MKTLLICLVFAVSASAQTLDYDKFTGTDYYKSKRVEVYRKKGGVLAYNPAAVEAQSFKVLKKPGFTLSLKVDSFDWQFTSACMVRFLADDKRYEYPCDVADSRAYSLGRDVYVREDLQVPIPAEDFRKILNSKVIQIQVGSYEFRLKDKHAKELIKVDVPEITNAP